MPTESLPLRDIHLPLPVGIWPLAPGWWFLIAALITATAVILFLIQRHRRPTALKQALAEVKRLFKESELSKSQLNQEISLILKKLAITTYPREDVAGLSGEEWISWLRLRIEDRTLSEALVEFLWFGAYSSNGELSRDQHKFHTEIHRLLESLGNSNRPSLSGLISHRHSMRSKVIREFLQNILKIKLIIKGK